jgi:predicted MFS family arabinose efflux permease
VFAISLGGTHGWGSPSVVASILLFALGLPALFWTQRHERFPLIDLSLFRDRERAIAFAVTFVLSLARFGLVLLIALYLQAAHGWTAQHTGLIIIPAALGMMIASPLAARLARHYSARYVATAGLGLVAAGLYFLAVELNPRTGTLALTAAMGVVGIGSGLFMTPNTSSIMASVGADRRGVANGLRSMLQSTGTVTGTALCLAIITAPLAPKEQAAAYAGTLSTLSRDTLPTFTAGYHRALLLLAVVTTVGAVASLLRNPPPTG